MWAFATLRADQVMDERRSGCSGCRSAVDATFAALLRRISALAGACVRVGRPRAPVNALWAPRDGRVTRGETRPLWRVALAALDAGALTRRDERNPRRRDSVRGA